MANNKQLTRIVAPNINEVDYADKMQEVFNNINENFAKIASLPFIQGVQGDSYQLEEKEIWNSDWTITTDGAILLNSIFGLYDEDYIGRIIVEGDYFNTIRNTILQNKKIGSISPIDFFKNENGEIQHNYLYFYVVKNDEGEDVERQLGQYYYFIDGRLKIIGDKYNDGTLGVFDDYTGFYQYIPEIGNERYERVDILPTIYYDQSKNDICWKFNGAETGISAIGVTGSNGKDSSFQIVLVDIGNGNPNENMGSLVNAVFKFNSPNNPSNSQNPGWDPSLTGISEGYAMIVIQTTIVTGSTSAGINNGKQNYIAYGQLKKEGNDWYASWNTDTITDLLKINVYMNNYFYNMGANTNNYPMYLAIPSDYNRTNNGKAAHILRTGSTGNLVLSHTDEAWNSNLEQIPNPTPSQYEYNSENNKKIVLDNYDLMLKKSTDSGANYTKIKHGSISILGDNDKDVLEVVNGNTKLTGELEVGGKTTLKNDTLINGKLTVDNDNVEIGTLAQTGTNAQNCIINISKVRQTQNSEDYVSKIKQNNNFQNNISALSILSNPKGILSGGSVLSITAGPKPIGGSNTTSVAVGSVNLNGNTTGNASSNTSSNSTKECTNYDDSFVGIKLVNKGNDFVPTAVINGIITASSNYTQSDIDKNKKVLIKPQLIIEPCPRTSVTNPSRQLIVKGKSEFTDSMFVNGSLVLKERISLTSVNNIKRAYGIAFCIADGYRSNNIDLRKIGDSQGFPKGSIIILYGYWITNGKFTSTSVINTPSSEITLSNLYEQDVDTSVDSIKITMYGKNIGLMFLRVEDVGNESSWVVLNK